MATAGFITLNGGKGDDTLQGGNGDAKIIYTYAAGDGNDLIGGFNGNSTLIITGASYFAVDFPIKTNKRYRNCRRRKP